MPHGDAIRPEPHLDRAPLEIAAARLEYLAAAIASPGAGVGPPHLRPAAAPQAADDDQVGPRLAGDVGWQARDAAVMRRHEHVADLGFRRHEPGQSIPLDVAGEEQPAARGLDREHDARLVVVGTAFVLMQHPDSTERIGGDFVTCRELADRYPAFVDQTKQFTDGESVAPQESPGDRNLPDPKPLQQIGHGIEMIGVGMGENERVDPADRPAPENGGHPPAGGSRSAETARVVDDHPSPGTADDDPAAMPHGRHDHLDGLRSGARHCHANPAQPRPCQRRQNPCGRPKKGLAGQTDEHRTRSEIPADRPPERWPDHPRIASRNQRGSVHDRFDRPEDEIAEAAEESGDE